MGRLASSPRVIVTSPSSCFCSWSAWSCHIMLSVRMRGANLGSRSPLDRAATALLAASPPPSSRRRDLRGAGLIRPCSEPLLLVLCCGRLPAPPEGGAVDPHPVQDDGELACQCHLGALHPASLGDLQSPALERRKSHRPRQQDVRTLIQRGAHHGVADPTDRPRD